MKRKIDIDKGVLRNINKGYDFYERYFLPCNSDDKIKWFLSCLCAEKSFLNSNKKHSFQEEIKDLSVMCSIDITRNQIEILSDLIGKFEHQHRTPVPYVRLLALDINMLVELTNLLIDGKVCFDTHIAVRNDLVYFESIHEILEYDLYKKLVFKTCCKTTSCYSNGKMNQFFNPMEKVKHNLWLKDDDYKELCKQIFK